MGKGEVEGEGEEGKGVLARAPQQMDKCLCFAPLYFLLMQFPFLLI